MTHDPCDPSKVGPIYQVSKPYSFFKQLWTYKLIYIRALRSRSLRDGSLSYKGRSATFVRSCSALRASRRPKKVSYLKSACLITPFGRWNQVNPTIFEICLLYVNNNNKYSYEKFLNAKFGISVLVCLY